MIFEHINDELALGYGSYMNVTSWLGLKGVKGNGWLDIIELVLKFLYCYFELVLNYLYCYQVIFSWNKH